MSLDYQKNIYHPRRARSVTARNAKTSYECMNSWNDLNTCTDYLPQFLYENRPKRAAKDIHFRYLPKQQQEEHPLGQPPIYNSQAAPHLSYYKSGGYDDTHKAALLLNRYISPDKQTQCQLGVPSRLRNGNTGSSWRHVRQVLEPRGNYGLFIEGQTKWIDNQKAIIVCKNKEEEKNKLLVNFLLPCVYKKTAKERNYELVKDTQAVMEAFKATEGGNWQIVR